MSGRYTFTNTDVNKTEQSLYLIALNETFSLDGNFLGAALRSTEALPESPWKGDGGAFLYDNTTLYFYAGLDQEYEVSGLWGFDISDSYWKPIGVGNGNFQVGIRRDG